MSGWTPMAIAAGDRKRTPRKPQHEPHADANPVEEAFTLADRRMLDTEQRLNRTRGGAAFAARIRAIR